MDGFHGRDDGGMDMGDLIHHQHPMQAQYRHHRGSQVQQHLSNGNDVNGDGDPDDSGGGGGGGGEGVEGDVPSDAGND